MPPRRAMYARQAGSTLVEVLVSVLVLATGLFGAASLQLSALRNNQSSYEQAQMTVLTQSMFDAMRANPNGAAFGEYELADWTCTAPAGATLASADLGLWLSSVQAQIHAGACGRVTCSGRDCLVGVRWDDSRAGDGNHAQVFELRGRL